MATKATTSNSYQAQAGALTLTATGDALITRRLPNFSEPGFTKLVDRVRSADVAFTNLETIIRRDEGWPQAETGGATWVWSEPEVLDDLITMGFSLLATAQNHMLDWGQEGLVASLRYIEAAELVSAGAGRTLMEARRPAYLELPQGRVALIGVTSTFHEWNRAGDARPDCAGRPGINPLRILSSLQVRDDKFRMLRQLVDALHLQDVPPRVKSATHAKRDNELVFMGQRIRLGGEDEIAYTVDPIDRDAVFAAIAEARRQADWVFLSLHSHEMDGEDATATPVCLRRFSQECVERGVDAVLGHGAHVVRGIELHQGRPILHGLGNLFFQNETLPYQPADFYERNALGVQDHPGQGFEARTDGDRRGFAAKPIFWEGIAATCQWSQRQLTSLSIDPLLLGFGLPRSMRGRPLAADGEAGHDLIKRLGEMSEPYGTTVAWDESQQCGVVALPTCSST